LFKLQHFSNHFFEIAKNVATVHQTLMSFKKK